MPRTSAAHWRLFLLLALSVSVACGDDDDGDDTDTATDPDMGGQVDMATTDAEVGDDAGPDEDGGGGTPDMMVPFPDPMCGDGVVDPGELCDGNCPRASACEDGAACTTNRLEGSARTCDARCVSDVLAVCANDDGCCPSGCTDADDNDCACEPRTCEGACGVNVPDGCGNLLDCGACGIGGPCASNEGCTTNFCLTTGTTGWDEGYCTESCTLTSDCGANAHCAFIEPTTLTGLCVLDCTADADCRTPDYGCFDSDGDTGGVTECAPIGSGLGDVGDPCTSFSDCGGGGGGLCIPEDDGWFEGYCSVRCGSDTDCPTGSDCNEDRNICEKSCTTDAECRSDGYVCYDADGDADRECHRGGTGPGAVGDACLDLQDCGGGAPAICLGPSAGFFAGYCSTAACESDADCASGSHCADAPEGELGQPSYCAADCATDADCRAFGYSCYDSDGNGSNECWPSGTGTGDVGDVCRGQWNCMGEERGRCLGAREGFDGGYCTLTGCVDGGMNATGCPAAAHCSVTTGDATGWCLQDCTAAADCRGAGYDCIERMDDADGASECWRSGTGSTALGDRCEDTADCTGGEGAFCAQGQFFPGGYCSQGCENLSCPSGSLCADNGTGLGEVCLEQCASGSDCLQPYYSCTPVAGGSVCEAGP